MSIPLLSQVLVKAFVSDKYIFGNDELLDDALGSTHYRPFDDNKDLKVLCCSELRVSEHEQKGISQALENSIAQRYCAGIVGYGGGAVVCLGNCLYVLGFQRAGSTWRVLRTISSAVEDITNIAINSEGNIDMVVCITKSQRLLSFDIATGELLFESAVPFEIVGSPLFFKILGSSSIVLSNAFNEVCVMCRDVCDISPSRMISFDYKLAGLIVYYRHYLYVIFDDGSYEVAKYTVNSGLVFDIDYKFTMPVQGNGFGESAYGKIVAVIGLGKARWVVCQEYGWVIYGMFDSKIVHQISSPISSRFVDAAVSVDGDSYKIAITTANMAVMVVCDGNVRLVESNNRCLQKCFFVEGYLMGIFSDDTQWWSRKIDPDDDTLAWDERVIIPLFEWGMTGNSVAQKSLDNQHCLTSLTCSTTISSSLVVTGNDSGELAFASSEGFGLMRYPLLESSVVGISYFSIPVGLLPNIIWARDSKGNLALLLFAEAIEAPLPGFKAFLIPRKPWDTILSVHVLKGYTCISVDYASGTRAIIDLASFAPILYHRDRVEHIPMEFELSMFSTETKSVFTVKDYCSTPQYNAMEDSALESPSMTADSFLSFDTKHGFASTESAVFSLLHDYDNDTAASKFQDYATATYNTTFFLRDMCRCCLICRKEELTRCLHLLYELFPKVSWTVDEIVRTWRPKLKLASENYPSDTEEMSTLYATIILGTLLSHETTHLSDHNYVVDVITSVFNCLHSSNARVKVLMLKLLSQSFELLSSRHILDPVYFVRLILKIRLNHNVRLISGSVQVDDMLVFDECTKIIDALCHTDPDFVVIIAGFLLSNPTSGLNQIEDLSLKAEVIEILNFILLESPDDSFVFSPNRIFLILNALLQLEPTPSKTSHHHYHHHRVGDVSLQLHDALDLCKGIITSKFSRICAVAEYPDSASSRRLVHDTAARGHKTCVSLDLKSISHGTIQEYAAVVYEDGKSGRVCYTLNWNQDRKITSSQMDAEPHLSEILVGQKFSPDGKLLAGIDFSSYSIVIWDITSPKTHYPNLVSEVDVPLRVSNFAYLFVQYYWRSIRSGVLSTDSSNEGDLLEALKELDGASNPQVTGYITEYASLLPAKCIGIRDILRNYHEVFLSEGRIVSEREVFIEWLANDGICLKIGEKIVYVYSIDD
ncbi:unnamed protein product [Kuraishia capsulata CBS 1993]|uniref:Uncharacterized protein n=1 Tax=Kuraishia capsulata CBS 1993 TaxID=1382522 RepID=W6MJ70_9ASCO|nr:uncharacterized protein KUCA_T00002262001 [Kuraishia capsulata CBS 1993]CDK26291.1 unnamed protein product [Kuraishia capsulata CBS 1993]